MTSDSSYPPGINISHLGKRKIIFKRDFWWDMLVPWRVNLMFFEIFRGILTYHTVWVISKTNNNYVRCAYILKLTLASMPTPSSPILTRPETHDIIRKHQHKSCYLYSPKLPMSIYIYLEHRTYINITWCNMFRVVNSTSKLTQFCR